MVDEAILDINKPVKIEDWNWTCPYCNSEDLIISPIDIVYQPHTYRNYDNLPKEIRQHYEKLPTILDAIMLAYDSPLRNINVECLNCKTNMRGFMNERPPLYETNRVLVKPDKATLKKKVKDMYGCDDSFFIPTGN